MGRKVKRDYQAFYNVGLRVSNRRKVWSVVGKVRLIAGKASDSAKIFSLFL